jgi:hypothetical protein
MAAMPKAPMINGSPPVKARCVGPLRVARDGVAPPGLLGLPLLVRDGSLPLVAVETLVSVCGVVLPPVDVEVDGGVVAVVLTVVV